MSILSFLLIIFIKAFEIHVVISKIVIGIFDHLKCIIAPAHLINGLDTTFEIACMLMRNMVPYSTGALVTVQLTFSIETYFLSQNTPIWNNQFAGYVKQAVMTVSTQLN